MLELPCSQLCRSCLRKVVFKVLKCRNVGGVEKQICIIYVSKDKNGIPALIDIDIQIINTRDDHFKEKDINNDPTADATSTHAWKNTELKAKIYYVRLNQKTVAEDIRKLFTNQI